MAIEPEEAIKRCARDLALRRDMVTFLEFIREEEVVGTKTRGNMPLKAIKAVTSRFVNPPPLEYSVGNKVKKIRSEEDIFDLYFVDTLATAAGLIYAPAGRRWYLTLAGEAFLRLPPLNQVVFLLGVWRYHVNWLICFPYEGMGDYLPDGFEELVFRNLMKLELGKPEPFKPFAKRLIKEGRLTWKCPGLVHEERLLVAAVERMVIRIMEKFGVLKVRYGIRTKYGFNIEEPRDLEITLLGKVALPLTGRLKRKL